MTSAPSPTARTAPLRTAVATAPAALEPHLAAWDALAVAASQPFCAPGWMLAWWRHARGGDARLRVVLVHDGDELVGVGPFFAQVGRLGLVEMRVLGAGFCHRIGPLARPGDESRVAAALARALADMRPRPASVVFEGIEAAAPWPDLIAASWPSGRRPRLRTDALMPAPVVELGGSYDAWLERRSRRFRKESRRTARRLEEHGVRERLASDDDAVRALLSLHHARWEQRGGSDVEDAATQVVMDAARALAPERRLTIALLEGPDGPVSAELLLCAGETGTFWTGGFDPAWAKHAPGTQTMLVALRAASDAGIVLADLGGGAHAYKQRMADADRPIAWRTVFAPGWREPLIRLRLAPKHASHGLRALARRLPEGHQERLRQLLRGQHQAPGPED